MLLAAGLRRAAAEVAALLAESWWHRADRDRCFEQLAAAEELVRDRGPSVPRRMCSARWPVTARSPVSRTG